MLCCSSHGELVSVELGVVGSGGVMWVGSSVTLIYWILDEESNLSEAISALLDLNNDLSEIKNIIYHFLLDSCSSSSSLKDSVIVFLGTTF
ncbi:hypothetical protein Csa_020659 [Cucumis sativus]|uniref:Uncharacterized protein n=1 Tax=Cucumis sativus TaxID=3659 RepID=A0A0A0KEH0_CUCSA|nr:hypothetical protein Csa_020659 [Cucumis sativus]